MTPDDLKRLLSAARVARETRKTGVVPLYPSGQIHSPGYYDLREALDTLYWPRRASQPPPRADDPA